MLPFSQTGPANQVLGAVNALTGLTVPEQVVVANCVASLETYGTNNVEVKISDLGWSVVEV